MRHTELHRAGDSAQEGALVRGGHLVDRLYHVHAADRAATLRNEHAEGDLLEDQEMRIQVRGFCMFYLHIMFCCHRGKL